MDNYILSSDSLFEGELNIENLPPQTGAVEVNLTSENDGEIFSLLNDILSQEGSMVLLIGEGTESMRVSDAINFLTENSPLHYVQYTASRRFQHIWIPTEKGLDSLKVDWLRKGSAALISRSKKFPESIHISEIKHKYPAKKSNRGRRGGGRGNPRRYHNGNHH